MTIRSVGSGALSTTRGVYWLVVWHGTVVVPRLDPTHDGEMRARLSVTIEDGCLNSRPQSEQNTSQRKICRAFAIRASEHRDKIVPGPAGDANAANPIRRLSREVSRTSEGADSDADTDQL